MTDAKAELAKLIAEIREDIVPQMAANLVPGDECDVCGIEEFRVEEDSAESRLEWYFSDCQTYGCDGEMSFVRVLVEANGGLPISKSEFVNVSCTGCDGDGIRALEDMIVEMEPAEQQVFDLPVAQLLTTQIHVHHTSYKPEKTVRVCNSCHAKIHHNDDFRPDLVPDIPRKEWEKQPNRGEDR